jgi:putative proteasome-type protease
MTYCLAIELEEGLVFCSDSRTNAGPDRVSTYSKMHRFSVPYDRSLVVLTAGNLATSQAVISACSATSRRTGVQHLQCPLRQ